MRNWLVLACVGILLIGSTRSALAQSPQSADEGNRALRFDEVAVTGVVKNLDGSPAVGAVVSTRLSDSRTVSGRWRDIVIRTDAEGRFSFGAHQDQLTYMGLLASTEGGDLQGFVEAPFEQDPGAEYWKGIVILLHQAQPLSVSVFDTEGLPAKHAKLWMVYPSRIPSPPPIVTNERGLATVRFPHNLPVETILAVSESTEPREAGLDYHDFQPEGSRRSIEALRKLPESVELRLAKLVSFAVKTMDEEKKPVTGARVIPSFRREGKLPFRLVRNDLPDWLQPRSNAEGEVTIWVPEDVDEPVSVSASSEHFVSLETSGRRYDSKGEHPTGRLWDRQNPYSVIIPMRDLRKSMTTLRGRVIDAEGKPVEGAAVCASGMGYQRPNPFYKSGSYSDAKGEFSLPISKEMFYLVTARTGDHRVMQTSFTVAAVAPQPVTLKVAPAHKVVIRVLDHASCQPKPGVTVQVTSTTKHDYDDLYVAGNEDPKLAMPDNPASNFSLYPSAYMVRAKSNERGEVEAYLPHGQFEVVTFSDMPGQGDTSKFAIRPDFAPKEIELYAATGGRFRPPAITPVRTKGKITDVEGKPIAYASVTFDSRVSGSDRQLVVAADSDGEIDVDRSPRTTSVRVLSPDESLGASTTLLSYAPEFSLKLMPTAKVSGQLIDKTTKKPLAGLKVTSHRGGEGWFTGAASSLSVTNEAGNFVLPSLIVGVDYAICVAVAKELDPSGSKILSTITIEKAGQEIDLKQQEIGPRD